MKRMPGFLNNRAVLRVLGFAALLGGSAPRAGAQGVEVTTKNAVAAETPRFRIESGADTAEAYFLNAKLGIGTATPNEILEVAGSVRGNQSGALRISTGNGYVDVGPKNAGWAHFYTDRARYYFDKGVTVDTGEIGSYNEDLSLQTAGTTRITVRNADGYVGIGTAAPRAMLDVPSGSFYAGDRVRVTAPAGASNAGVLEMVNETNGWIWQWALRSSDADKLIFYRNNGAWGSVLTLTQDQRVGIATTAPRGTLDIATAGAEASIFGLDRIVGMNDIRFYEDDAGTTMIAYLDAGRLHMAHTANPGIELRDTDGGTPYVDFANDGAVDYDGRLILNSDAELGLADTRLRITSGDWAGMFYTNTAGRTISLENNAGMPGGGGLRVWDQSGAGSIADLGSDQRIYIGANIVYYDSGGGTIKMHSPSNGNNLWFNWDGTFRCYVDSTNVKNFVIDHPVDPARHLIHTTLEGPEVAVLYRGTARLCGGRAEIVLPAYFEALTREEGRTVLVTPEFATPDEPVSALGPARIRNGRFEVRALDGRNPDQKFSWEVQAVRKDVPPLRPEPRRDEVEVGGIGPYTWCREKRSEPGMYPE